MKGDNKMDIKKATEISNAKINFISLVDKAANKRKFLITKADDDKASFSTFGKILKVDSETHYVTGIVYEPLVEDAQGDFMTETEIRKAAYWFAKNGNKVDIRHSFENIDGVTVVENYIAPSNFKIEDTEIKKGTWIMTAEIENPEVWEKVQKGEVTGFSMGGVGEYSNAETDLTEAVLNKEKKSFFKSFAEFMGFNVIEKSKMTEEFYKRKKSDEFWNAFQSLKSTLEKQNNFNDTTEYETDEKIIRQELSDFSKIVQDILLEENIAKSLIKTEKGENEMSKAEVQKLIAEEVRKAVETETAANEPEPPKAESQITVEDVRKMVSEALEKLVEPILKSHGLPNNINCVVEKAEPPKHYLKGIL
jgi:hypothetical protein